MAHNRIIIFLLLTLILSGSLSGCTNAPHKADSVNNQAKAGATKADIKKLRPEKALQALKAIKPEGGSPLDNNYAFSGQQPVRAGGFLYLWRQSRIDSLELWRSNGHNDGTRRLLSLPLDKAALKDLTFHVPWLFAAGSRVMFLRAVPSLQEAKADLYISDGSVTGTRRVHTFKNSDFEKNASIQTYFTGIDHGARRYWAIDNRVYFIINKTLWRSHFITHVTEPFYDLSPYMNHNLTGLILALMHNKGNKLYFRALKKNPLTQHSYALWELNTQNKHIRPVFSTQHDLSMATIVSVFDDNEQIGVSIAKPYVVPTQEYWLLDIQNTPLNKLPQATLLLKKQQKDSAHFDYGKPGKIGSLLYAITSLPKSYNKVLWQLGTQAGSSKPVVLDGKYYLLVESTGSGEDLAPEAEGNWTLLARKVPIDAIDTRLGTRLPTLYPLKWWVIDAETQAITLRQLPVREN